MTIIILASSQSNSRHLANRSTQQFIVSTTNTYHTSRMTTRLNNTYKQTLLTIGEDPAVLTQRNVV